MKFEDAVHAIRCAGIDPEIIRFFESMHDDLIQRSDALVEMEKLDLSSSKEYRHLCAAKTALEEKLKDIRKELKHLKKQDRKHSACMKRLSEENASAAVRIRELESSNNEYQSLLADAVRKTKEYEAEISGIKVQLTAVLKELAETKEKLAKANHMNFGSSSEKGNSLMKEDPEKEDPLDEEASGNASETNDQKDQDKTEKESPKDKKNGRRKGSKNKMNSVEKWGGLPWIPELEYSWEEIDAMFGEGNWTFLDFQYHYSLETLPAVFYRKCMLTQILYVKGRGKVELTLKDSHNFQRGAMNSPSLIAYIITNRFQLGLPYYRQAAYLNSMGIPVSDKNMLMWIKGAVKDYYRPVYLEMIKELNRYSYHHCDETVAPVLKNNRKSGTTCYMWVHTLSRLLNAPPIVIFSFEQTRGTDHLREFYSEFMGWIMCDAYISYEQFEKEKTDISTSLCFAHLRRYFVCAARVLNGLKIPEEKKQNSPEYMAIQMIAEIYEQEYLILHSGETMDAHQMVLKRRETVAPKVDAFFEYIRSLDIDAPEYSASLKKAISYSVNHEERFRRFLSDGNLEIDNNEAERSLRGYCVGRRNWLFSDSVDGAENNAVLYSLVITAMKNGANVFFYIKYVTEVMAQHVRNGCLPDMDMLMPWSDAYKTYEAQSKEDRFSVLAGSLNSETVFPGNDSDFARFYPEKEKCSKAALLRLGSSGAAAAKEDSHICNPVQYPWHSKNVCYISRRLLVSDILYQKQDVSPRISLYTLSTPPQILNNSVSCSEKIYRLKRNTVVCPLLIKELDIHYMDRGPPLFLVQMITGIVCPFLKKVHRERNPDLNRTPRGKSALFYENRKK